MSYNIPVETSHWLVKEHTLWHEDTYGFVAYEGDKPVSTATALVNDGCLFLLLVATTSDARRKVYGEAVVRDALQLQFNKSSLKLKSLRIRYDSLKHA